MSRGRPEFDVKEVDVLKSLLRDVRASILDKGLYLAPLDNPVSGLLLSRDEDSAVYLL
jgi:hypothetical protein